MIEHLHKNIVTDKQILPLNPKNGAYIHYKNYNFVTLYNCVIDTYGIYKVEQDWSHYYWTPPESYIHPIINWELIWKEMDYCNYGRIRNYFYSETKYGPEISFYNSKL